MMQSKGQQRKKSNRPQTDVKRRNPAGDLTLNKENKSHQIEVELQQSQEVEEDQLDENNSYLRNKQAPPLNQSSELAAKNTRGWPQNESLHYKNAVNSGSMSSSFCQQPQNPPAHQLLSMNSSDFILGSGQQSNFVNFNETTDSNQFNEIKGRRVDSPQLLVVREMREMEEDEEERKESKLHKFGSGSEEILNLVWHSREFRQQANMAREDSQKKNNHRQTQKQTKSSDNKPAAIQRRNLKRDELQQLDRKQGTKASEGKSEKKGRFHPQSMSTQKYGQVGTLQGTKSQRELRSSMGFNELLNNLDKDMSMNAAHLQDFRNKTMHDLLKIESGTTRRPIEGKRKQDSKSRSQPKSGGAKGVKGVRSKSREGRKDETQLLNKEELDKIVGFIKKQTANMQQEHAAMNGRTKSHSNLLPSGSQQFRHLNNLGSFQKQNLFPQSSQQNHGKVQKDQSSPDRQFKNIGNIDKLIRDNIKKNKEKEEEERVNKLRQEETLKRKKEDLLKKNSIVRQANKIKIYKRQADGQYLMQQQSSDLIGQNQGELLASKKLKVKKEEQKFGLEYPCKSQSQKLDFEKFNQQHSKKITFKNHRKSYGLEFIEIKKEIEEELRTIEYKARQTNQLKVAFGQERNPNSINNTESSIRKQRSKKKVFDYDNKENADVFAVGKKVVVGGERKKDSSKKHKIRKFMEDKKKEQINAQKQERNLEVFRAIKMQQNLLKLNQFCKKKLEKKFNPKPARKRNTTIQGDVLKTDPDLSDQNRVNRTIKDASKISLKKKDKKVGQRSSKKKRDTEEDEEADESSKLSTEFYEEYFRLINSIKKEQAESSKNLLSDADINASDLLQIQKQLWKSPKQHENNISTQSPSSFQQIIPKKTFSPGVRAASGKGKKVEQKIRVRSGEVVGKKKRSKQEGGIKKMQSRQQQQFHQYPQTKDYVINQQQKLQQKDDRNNNRAESAPLLSYQNQLINKMNQQTNKQLFEEEEMHQEEHQMSYGHESQDEDYDTQVLQVQPDSQRYHQQIDSLEHFEEEEAGSSGSDEEEEQDMIIINQQPVSEENKVVYMSNINSCSLPQTPKEDFQSKKQNQLTIQTERSELTQKVFEYKPEGGDKFEEFKEEDEEEKVQFLGDKHKQFEKETLLHEFTASTPKENAKQIKIGEPHGKSLSIQGISSHHSQESMKQLQNLNQAMADSKKSNSNLNENTSQSSQSLFDRNSFQQFTMQKMHEIIKNNEFSNLIGMREKALEYRQKKENKFIKKMLKNNQMSPRTYNSRKEQLEKWVNVEKEEIQKTKKAFEQEWQKTVRMIEETQKDVEKMRARMKISIDNQKHHQNIFHSQSSRNTSSNQSNIASVKQEQAKPIILDDFSAENSAREPISQRTWRLISQQNQENAKPEEEEEKVLSKEISEQNLDRQENLFEFLEQSWQKQQNQVKDIIVEEQKRELLEFQLRPSDFSMHQLSKDGIFIQDQNEKISSEHDSQLEQMEPSHHLEKSLHRSRSEQDLKDLMRVVQYEEEGESMRGEEEKNQQQKNSIIIQENAYEEPEKEQNFYKDLQSNDSGLNESQLNQYFQEQQFSLDDFKSLDKKELIEKQVEDEAKQEEEETARLLRRQEEFEKQSESHHKTSEDPITSDQNDEFHEFTGDHLLNKQSLENNRGLEQEEVQNKSDIQVQPPSSFDFEPSRPAVTPEVPSTSQNYFQNQQNLLFSNAKPGENIRISDILKGAQSMTVGLDSFQSYNQESSNSNLFQNQQINQTIRTNTPETFQQNDHSELATQLTEELVNSLLGQCLQLPQRPILDQGLNEQVITFNQADNQDIFVIDAQINEREHRRELIDFRQRQLIEADLQKVEIYINEIIGTLLQSELLGLSEDQNESKVAIANYHKQFLAVLTNPIKKNELDILNQLQTSEIGSYDHFETTIDQSVFPILPVDLYLEIERQREETAMLGNLPVEVNVESSVVQESVHIHNKAVFDALNESLMKFRPYGLMGEPMPWSNKCRRLQTRVDASSVDTERLFQMVKQDVLRWVTTYSGCQPSPVFVFRKTSSQAPQVTNPQIKAMLGEQETFDEEQFQETRERRLAQMLASEVLETEHQWLNYEFEEAQVKIDLSDMILEHLVEEVAVFLNIKHPYAATTPTTAQ